jgi:hypothetical protein
LLLFGLLCGAWAGPPSFPNGSVFFPVTTTADSGPGSLRAAIEAAGDGVTIYFDPALNGQTIILISGELAINANITITGPGPNLLTVSRNAQASPFRIFHVLAGHAVIIEGLTIRGGSDDGGGGAIRNDRSTLSIRNCIIRESGSSGLGGGIYNDGSFESATLTIVDSSVTLNHSDSAGGGICNDASNGGHAILSLWNSSVTNNSASFFDIPIGRGDGGGIASSGKTTLTNCTVSTNYAGQQPPFPVGNGGGINNLGRLTIIGSTIDNNRGFGEGGGIYNVGTLAIISSTVSGNGAPGQHDGVGWGNGGGILNYGGALTITNSTLSNNYAADTGGGLRGGGTITNSTMSGNTATNAGGGILTPGILAIANTILKAGTSGANISNNGGTVTSYGYNLSSDDGGGFLNATGDQINTDPLLGPLQFNGGPTFTHELLTGSPAINMGDPDFPPPPFYDQRGLDYDRVFNGRLDIGSLEVQPAPTPSPPPTPAPTPCGLLTFLSENFDSTTPPALPPGWVSDFTPGPADCTPAGTCTLGTDWATTPTTPDTPPNSMFHDAPGCVTDSTLDTPFFEGGATNGTFLHFRHSYDLEDGRDGAVLEISINGGPFVDFVAAGGGNVGYNGTISTDLHSPIAGRAAWTGNSGGYVDTFAQMPLSALGRTVRLRFRVATDCSGAGTGWRIDSIEISDNIGCQPPSPTPPPPSPTPTPSATATPTATVPPPTPTPSATATPSPTPAQALNISTRLRVEPGDRVMIGGFIVTGSAPNVVALRGIGPSLVDSGISDVLADPTLELRDSGGALLFQNDDWQDDPSQAAQLTVLGLALQDPKESGIVAPLQPGASYTAILAGQNGGSGVGLVEIYDTNQGADSQLANISTRGFVQTGDNVMIGGFILGGSGAGATVAVRGIGPSLGQSGLSNVLADPTLELRDSNGAILVSNDNWQDDLISAAQLTAHGLAPQDSLESGIFASLPPGAFTAILAGSNNGVGLGLVEIYNVQ